jgi:hypothetical protein
MLQMLFVNFIEGMLISKMQVCLKAKNGFLKKVIVDICQQVFLLLSVTHKYYSV